MSVDKHMMVTWIRRVFGAQGICTGDNRLMLAVRSL